MDGCPTEVWNIIQTDNTKKKEDNHKLLSLSISVRQLTLNLSPLSPVPGSMGITHNCSPGKTEWGQNKWHELKHVLVSQPSSLCVCTTHSLMPRKKTNGATDFNCWTLPPFSHKMIVWRGVVSYTDDPVQEVMQGANRKTTGRED